MKAYYHARAREYDDWWLGRGLFADRVRPGWEEALAELADAIAALPPARTLDVACGTGFLTRHLRGDVTGLDQSQAMLDEAGRRVPQASFVAGDALALPFADTSFDRVFSSFFYCHLEEDQRVQFLKEAGRVASELVVVGSIRRDEREDAGWEERTLGDGTTWTVYKRYFEPGELADELGGEILLWNRWFVMVRAPRA